MTLQHIVYLTRRKQTTMFLSFHFATSSSLFALPSVSRSKLQLMKVAGKAKSVS